MKFKTIKMAAGQYNRVLALESRVKELEEALNTMLERVVNNSDNYGYRYREVAFEQARKALKGAGE